MTTSAANFNVVATSSGFEAIKETKKSGFFSARSVANLTEKSINFKILSGAEQQKAFDTIKNDTEMPETKKLERYIQLRTAIHTSLTKSEKFTSIAHVSQKSFDQGALTKPQEAAYNEAKIYKQNLQSLDTTIQQELANIKSLLTSKGDIALGKLITVCEKQPSLIAEACRQDPEFVLQFIARSRSVENGAEKFKIKEICSKLSDSLPPASALFSKTRLQNESGLDLTLNTPETRSLLLLFSLSEYSYENPEALMKMDDGKVRLQEIINKDDKEITPDDKKYLTEYLNHFDKVQDTINIDKEPKEILKKCLENAKNNNLKELSSNLLKFTNQTYSQVKSNLKDTAFRANSEIPQLKDLFALQKEMSEQSKKI